MLNDKQKLKVCAYVRVSTRSEHQRQSFDQQIEYWKSTLSNHPNYEFVKVYSDYGYSGKDDKRPAYNRMIKDALDNKIDLIFTKSISRFGRNAITISSDLLRLKENNVFIFFESENITTQDDDVNLFISLYSSVHEEELNDVSKSIKFGFKNKFEAGSMLCKPIFGYDVKRKGNDYDFTIIPEQADTVNLIFSLYNSGKSFTQIAKYLSDANKLNRNGSTVWNAPMIPYILANEKYTGDILSQKYYNEKYKTIKNNPDLPDKEMYLIENHHKPIITREVFDIAKERLNSRNKKPRIAKSKNNDIYPEYLFCGKCDNPYKRIVRKNYNGEDITTYRCGKNRYKSECCHNSTIYPDTFQSLFIKAYNQFAEIKNIGTDKCDFLNAQIANQQAIINDLIASYNNYGTEIILPNFKFRLINRVSFNNELDKELRELDALKYDLDMEVGHIINNKKIQLKMKQFKESILIAVLEKAIVIASTINFVFKNGVVIEKNFSNPKPGKKSKIL